MTSGPLEVAWYTFLHDFTDAGVELWVAEIRDTGATAANVAVVYHTARDVLPRNPRRRLRFMTGGTHYFDPDPTDYPALAQPLVDPDARGTGAMLAIRDTLRANGLGFNAWAVFCHNSRLAGAQPSLAQRNAFGDGMLTDLCPSNPEVRAYAVAVARQTARLSPDTIIAESLHFHGLRHGYHHERYLFDLGDLAELALSWCFCEHCRSEARADGIDIDQVQRWAMDTATAAFDGTPQHADGELTRSEAVRAGGPEVEGFLDMRSRVVTRLATEVRQAAHAGGSRLAFIDPSGAVKGWATGEPEGRPVPESGWMFGIDIADVAASVDAIEVLGYTRAPQRLASDLADYRDRVGTTPMRLSMRPAAPDTDDADHLQRKLLLARESGASAVDLYHLGLLPPTAARRVREATTSLSSRLVDT